MGSESGTYSIYFMQEQVGYEEYRWEEDEAGFTLSVRGRMTKPIALEIENLAIRLDRSFIPQTYLFKGKVSGMMQEIQSVFKEGRVENTQLTAGLRRTDSAEIKRDAVLLPNPIFSPYMVLTKKFGCRIQEARNISAYIIPQMEIPATLESKSESPCQLLLHLGQTEIEITTDEEGVLVELAISSQSLKVVRTQVGVPIR